MAGKSIGDRVPQIDDYSTHDGHGDGAMIGYQNH